MQSDDELGLADYLAVVKRRWLLAVAIAVPIILAGAVVALALPDAYSSTAAFRLVTDRIAETTAEHNEYADQYVYRLADKVFASEELVAILKGINPYPGLDDQVAKVRRDTDVAMSTRSLLEPDSGRERIIPIGFTVTVNHTSPKTVQEVAEVLMKAFVEIGRSDQLLVATTRSEFFTSEAERVRRQIADLEGQLADFKTANFDRLPEAANAKLGTQARLEQDLDNVDREIRNLQQNRVFVVQQLRQAQEGTMAGNLRALEEEYARRSAVYAETHPDVVALRRQIDSLKRGANVATGNTLRAQVEQQRAVLAETRQRYSEDHPDIRRLVRSIESLEAQIAADTGSPTQANDTLLSVQLQTQLNAIDTQIAGLRSRAGNLQVRLNELDKQLGAAPEVEREYQEIARGLGSAREQYNQMIAKRLDADAEVVAINSGAADRFTLFAAPTAPWGPSGPPRVGIFVVAVMLSLMVALPAGLLAELADPTLRGVRDVRTLLGQSPLASVPEIRTAAWRRRRRNRVGAFATCAIVGASVLFFVIRVLAS